MPFTMFSWNAERVQFRICGGLQIEIFTIRLAPLAPVQGMRALHGLERQGQTWRIVAECLTTDERMEMFRQSLECILKAVAFHTD